MKRVVAFVVSMIYVVTVAFANIGQAVAEGDFVRSWNATVNSDKLVITIEANDKENWGYNAIFDRYPLMVTADGEQYTFTIPYGGNDIKGKYYSTVDGADVKLSETDFGQRVVIKIPLSYFNNPGSISVMYNDEDRDIITEAETTEALTEATTEEVTTETTEVEEATTEAADTDEATTEAATTEESATEAATEAAEPGSEETTPSLNSDTSGYHGIVIDGDFSDWDGITKSDFVGTSDTAYNNVLKSAIVYDGDVYIYLEDNSGIGSAAWAGPNHNGKFAVISDLGKQIIFDLDNDGSATGVDGITSTRTGAFWEIKIPEEQIPVNNGFISFGYYLGEPTFTNVPNLKGTEAKDVGEIKYDYSYADWERFPHTVIEYDTAGKSNKVVDSHGTVYLSDSEILGHVETNHPNHVNSRGGDLLFGVHTIVNNKYDMEWRVVAVDSAGNINWNPQREGLSNGSYEFYIFDTKCWGSSKNLSELVERDICFGRAYLTIRDDSSEMEWTIDSKKLADFFGLDETDLRVVSSIYKRLGDEVIDSAGVSTGGFPAAVGTMLVAFGMAKIATRRREQEA